MSVILPLSPSMKNARDWTSPTTNGQILGDEAPLSLLPHSIPSVSGPGHLITSPYTEIDHQLDLTTLSLQDQLFARALTIFSAQRSDYALAPYIATFNLSQIVQGVQKLCVSADHAWKEQGYYIVVFRSQIPQTTDYAHLGDLDKEAHYEAVKSGGFLKYWFGSPDKQGRNLATCIWRNPMDAKKGSMGSSHRKAAGATRFLYTEWKIERLRLTIKDGAESWTLTDWED